MTITASEQNGVPKGTADRLESWKEIAVYLNRDVRTVQRWEKKEGLPVHRLQHDRLGTIYAYKSEIDAWRERRSSLPEDRPEASEPPLAAEEAVVEAAPVQAPEAITPDAAEHETHPPRAMWLVWGLTVILFIAAAWYLRTHPRPFSQSQRISIVVLPFTDLAEGPKEEYFSDGMTEELITQLGRLHSSRLHVIALASSMTYKDTAKKPRDIARELNVDYILNGTVRRDGGRVRITAHLVHASDDVALWHESYDRDMRDVLTLEGDVANAIATAVSLQLDTQTQRARPVNPESYDAYLKGRFFWNKRTAEDLNRAIDQFTAATNKDAEYAPAWVGLADSYSLLGSAEIGALPPNEAMPKAKAAALRAISLDDGLAEAHASLAYIHLIYDWDWAAADAEFKRAIALNPAYATAHQWYALYLSAMGRTNDAIAEINKAQELDPRSPAIRTALAEAYYFSRQYDQAVVESRKALELDPRFVLGYINLGRAYLYMKRYDDAIAAYEQGRVVSGGAPAISMFLAQAVAAKGDRRPAQQTLAALTQARATHYVPALYVGVLEASIGDNEAALKSLDKAIQERCEYVIYLGRDPMADPVRNDPRFAALLEKLQMPRALP